MSIRKELTVKLAKELEKAGFKGEVIKYDGCSCCQDCDDKAFFRINLNKAENWGSDCIKIGYELDNKKKAEEFRKVANRLAKKYFGKLVDPAKNINEAIIINLLK